MNKIILTLTSLLVIFSVFSHAELTSYYVKQAQAKEHTTIKMEQSAKSDFQTAILNINSHITNK